MTSLTYTIAPTKIRNKKHTYFVVKVNGLSIGNVAFHRKYDAQRALREFRQRHTEEAVINMVEKAQAKKAAA